LGAAVSEPPRVSSPFATLPLRRVEKVDVVPYENAVPVFDLQVAAGTFSDRQVIDDCEWVELPEPFVAKEGHFVTRVVGESMNRRIPNGSWCLFKARPAGSRDGKAVLVQHRDIQDADNGGQFTIKIYQSEKAVSEDSWSHTRIVLKPDSTISGFKEIVLERDQVGELTVLGELVAVLGQKDAWE
jgi:SOS-response transcriptional repressor LexA